MPNKNLNIPNVLSVYRLLSFPLMVYFISTGQEQYFILFLIIGLVSDVLDGFLARRFNWQTALGAKLDSSADILMNIAAVAGIYFFKWEEMRNEAWIIYLFFSLYILFHLLAYLKYRAIPSFHTYAFKTAAYFQGAFMIILFLWGYSVWFLYIVLAVSIIAQLEEFILLYKLKRPVANVKGLFFLSSKQAKKD